MTELTLILGNKNYSSWSLRPWLLMKHFQIPFAEIRVPLYSDSSLAKLKKLSPSGKVPALIAGDFIVWDSLAICEYIADQYPQFECWPKDPRSRATARSMSAEMHSGFQDLRSYFPMNIRKRVPWDGAPEAVMRDIERITELWQCCIDCPKSDGPWLFGKFGIVDAMFAPVVWRFVTYNVPVDETCKQYMDNMLALPEMQEWVDAACAETEVIMESEKMPGVVA